MGVRPAQPTLTFLSDRPGIRLNTTVLPELAWPTALPGLRDPTAPFLPSEPSAASLRATAGPVVAGIRRFRELDVEEGIAAVPAFPPGSS